MGALTGICFLNGADEAWGFLVGWVLGIPPLLILCPFFKRVQLEDNTLVVSNYLGTSATIPLSEVEKICARGMRWPHSIWIRLKNRTPIGRRFCFIPDFAFGCWSHPVATELRRLVERMPAPPDTPTSPKSPSDQP